MILWIGLPVSSFLELFPEVKLHRSLCKLVSIWRIQIKFVGGYFFFFLFFLVGALSFLQGKGRGVSIDPPPLFMASSYLLNLPIIIQLYTYIGLNLGTGGEKNNLTKYTPKTKYKTSFQQG